MALARAALGEVDEVLFVLPRVFPHKAYQGASFEQRMAMLSRAVDGEPRFSIGSTDGGLFIEIAQECRVEYPRAALVFLCGRDAAERIVNWDYGRPGAFAGMLETFELLVAARSGDYQPPAEFASRIHPLHMDADYDDVSATEVRERIARRLPWEHLVHLRSCRQCARFYCPETVFAAGVVRVHFRDVRRLVIARMDDHTIAETQRLSRLQGHAAVARLIVVKIVLAENVRGEQSVAAGVPVRRMLRILGMIQNRDARLSRPSARQNSPPTRSVCPRSAFLASLPCASTILPVRFGSAGDFFCGSSSPAASRIAKKPSLVSPNVDFGERLETSCRNPSCACSGRRRRPSSATSSRSVWPAAFHEKTASMVPGFGAAFHRHHLFQHHLALLGAVLGRLVRPEVEAVHVAMGEPQAAMMGMIVSLSGYARVDGIAARHDRAGGGAQGPEVRLRRSRSRNR